MRRLRIYLAARYSRREELCEYRAELVKLGYEVTARWLDGTHQISDSGTPIGDQGEKLIEGDDEAATAEAAELRSRFALEDVEDVRAADMVISFTEPPRSNASRGGRHVEFGIALAIGSPVVVVGHRENIFHWLPEVEFCESWAHAKRLLDTIKLEGLSERV